MRSTAHSGFAGENSAVDVEELPVMNGSLEEMTRI
jgi:hypothetical protein